MDAGAIRALAARKYPTSRYASLAQAFTSLSANGSLNPQELAAKGTTVHKAVEHALAYMMACRVEGASFDAEAIARNVENNFPSLGANDCDHVAQAALAISGAT